MCQLCQEKPVYEFTNQRKLCKRCFINYFQKKFLYTIRKFELIKQEDKIGYLSNPEVNSVVLKEMLDFFSKKSHFDIIPLKSLSEKKTITKIASSDCIDNQTSDILDIVLHKNVKELKDFLPKDDKNKVIRPLYLFLQEEITLFADLKGLKYSKLAKKKSSPFDLFIEDFQKLHPEVKRAVVNSLLKLYSL